MRTLGTAILVVGGLAISGCGSKGAGLPESCAALATKLQSEGKSLPDLTNMKELNRNRISLTCDVDGDGRITGDYLQATLEAQADEKGKPVCGLKTQVSQCSPSAITCGYVAIRYPNDPCGPVN